MKILFLSQGKKIEDHPGWHYALEQLRREGIISDFINIPYKGYAAQYGWPAFYEHVIELCRTQSFDLVYFHYFHGFKDACSPCRYLEALHNLPHKPAILTSAGDPFSDNWMMPDYPNDFKQCSRMSDIVFSTQMGKAADKMIKWGAKNVVYTPHSLCPVRFESCHIVPDRHNFDFDVIFIGNRNKPRVFNPLSKYSYAALKRERLVHALVRHYGTRLGLFGHGWEGMISWQGRIPFEQQQKTFQRGKIVVGGSPYSYSDYYASNRPFFAISSGVPTVEFYVPRLEHILRNQEHCYFCRSVDEILETCDRLLKCDPVELYAKAAKAADYIAERHTQYHRMKFKIETALGYRANGNKLDVAFPFFLPEIDLGEEMKYALRHI